MKITIEILEKDNFKWQDAGLIMNQLRLYMERMLLLKIGQIEATGKCVNMPEKTCDFCDVPCDNPECFTKEEN